MNFSTSVRSWIDKPRDLGLLFSHRNIILWVSFLFFKKTATTQEILQKRRGRRGEKRELYRKINQMVQSNGNWRRQEQPPTIFPAVGWEMGAAGACSPSHRADRRAIQAAKPQLQREWSGLWDEGCPWALAWMPPGAKRWGRQVGGGQGRALQESMWFHLGLCGRGRESLVLPCPPWVLHFLSLLDRKEQLHGETGWSLEESYKWLIVSRKRSSVSLLSFVTGFI